MKFDPPIEYRLTEELIEIANSTPDIWQQEAIDLAKQVLINRGITRDEQAKILAKWKKNIDNLEKKYQEQLIQNKTESYNYLEMIKIFFLAPFYLFGRWIADYTVFDLWRENYKKKFIQRLVLLLTGTLFWVILAVVSFNISEKNRLEEIEKIDISDWEKNRNGNDLTK